MAVTVDATGAFAFWNNTASPITYGPTGNANNTTGITTVAATAIGFIFAWENATAGSQPPGISSVIWDPPGANQTMSVVATGTLVVGQNVLNLQCIIFGLGSPASSGNKPIKVTYTGPSTTMGSYATAISFAGTDTTTPFRNGVGAGASNGGVLNPTITVTSPAGDIALAGNAYDFETMTSLVPAGGTTLFNDNSGPQGGAYAHRAAGAGSTTMSATSNANQGWSYAAVSVQPPTGAGDTLGGAMQTLMMSRQKDQKKVWVPGRRIIKPRRALLRAA